MSIISYFEQIVKYMQRRSLRIYLFLVNMLLVIFGIWFANASLLPFKNFSDFIFFVCLGLLFAIYRPGWSFLFFIGTIALENINLAPEPVGLVLRPYQFFAALTIAAIFFRTMQKKSPVSFPKFNLADWMVVAFACAGFLGSFFALEKEVSLKQSLIALSFVAIYFLVRTFIQEISDAKKIVPYLLGSSLMVAIFGIWQNIRFAKGLESFSVMPGRPNATFAEADWLGIFIVLLIAVVYAIIYYLNSVRYKKQETITNQISNYNFQNIKLFGHLNFGDRILLVSCILFLVFLYIVLILTVARSAWLGAFVVSLGFLKIILINSSWRSSDWQWKKTGVAALGILASLIFAIGIVKIFNLTSFELSNRAQSTASGLQEITVSCEPDIDLVIPNKIASIAELADFGCRHINLEEVESEKSQGNIVASVLRPDPNVEVRAEIYEKSWKEIRENPIFGIGWGSIGKILGADERGASLNASNIFLEVWLGAGLLGLISFLAILGYILFRSFQLYYGSKLEGRIISVFSALGLFAILVPNLFNAGIFLGFLWLYLGVTVSLLTIKK